MSSLQKSNDQINKDPIRRQRQHELLVALIKQQDDLELMDAEGSFLDSNGSNTSDPAQWLNRNRRVLSKYQALASSAIALDALLDSEVLHSD